MLLPKNKVKILLDNQEYFNCNSITCSISLNEGLFIRNAIVDCKMPYYTYVRFATDMTDKQVLLASIFIEDKLFLEGFLTLKVITTSISQDGMRVSFAVNDRFYPLLHSDVIKVLFFKSHSNLQLLLAMILWELGYMNYENYPRKITDARDFIKNGLGVKTIPLTKNVVKYATHEKAITIIQEIASIYKVVLNSNGSDTIFVEKYNSYTDPVYEINLKFDKNGNFLENSNVSNAQKVGASNTDNNDASRIVIVNPSINRKKPKIKDKHTSLVVNYQKGLPNMQIVRSINREVDYEGLKDGVNQSLLGLNTVANSYVYQFSDRIFDKNGDFFTPNRLINVKDEAHLINGKMSIIACSFSIDAENGSMTTLNVCFEENLGDNVNNKHKVSTIKSR